MKLITKTKKEKNMKLHLHACKIEGAPFETSLIPENPDRNLLYEAT